MEIDNFFVKSIDREIFCTLIKSEAPSSDCIIYFSPLFEERAWAQRVAFNFAKELASKSKFSVLMFDYYGHGESDGFSEEFTIASCLTDFEHILSYLKQIGYSTFMFWGIRTGSAIVQHIVNEGTSPAKMIHWAPVFDIYSYIETNLRGSVAGQYMLFKRTVAKREEILKDLLQYGKCEREGYVLNIIDSFRFGKDFFEETLNLNKYSNEESISTPTLIITVYKNKITLDNKSKNIVFPFINAEFLTHQPVVDREFWQIGIDYSQRVSSLYEITSNWLSKVTN